MDVGIADADIIVEQPDQGQHVLQVGVVAGEIEHRLAERLFEGRDFAVPGRPLQRDHPHVEPGQDAGDALRRRLLEQQMVPAPCSGAPRHAHVGWRAEGGEDFAERVFPFGEGRQPDGGRNRVAVGHLQEGGQIGHRQLQVEIRLVHVVADDIGDGSAPEHAGEARVGPV